MMIDDELYPFVNFVLIVIGYVPMFIAMVFLAYVYRKVKTTEVPEFAVAAEEESLVLIADMYSGDILHATPAVEKLFGYVRGELTGKNVDDLVPKSVQPRHAALRASFASDGQSRSLLCVGGRRKDEKEIDVDVSLRPRFINGRSCVVVVLFDKTRKR